MKTLILQQRKERDDLMSFDYQSRSVYEQAVSFLDSKPIKLITGPRRAGKSVLALQLLKGKNFAYLNFDDKSLLDNFSESTAEQAIEEVYPKFDYLLLDEVQNLKDWSLWVEKLYRRGVNMVITGSNANMLSDDMATVLSGRFLEIRLFPFSAKEYVEFTNGSLKMETPQEIASLNAVIENFSKYGGFPEVVKSPQVTSNYLSSLYDTIIVKDIVRRYNVRKVNELYNTADWLLSNFTNPFNYNSLAQELGLTSVNTVQNFCRYLQNTYLFQYLPRFNNKLKLMKKADQKVYVADNGFVMSRAFELTENKGRLLENLVFLELIKRGYDLKRYELFYYKSRNDKEIDFVCRKGFAVEQLIQVCYNLDSLKTRKREFDALVECAGELHNNKLVVITWDQEETVEIQGFTIYVVPFRKWMLNIPVGGVKVAHI